MKNSLNNKRAAKGMKAKQAKNRRKTARAEKARTPEYAMREQLIIKQRQKEKAMRLRAIQKSENKKNWDIFKKTRVFKILLSATIAALIIAAGLIAFFAVRSARAFTFSRDIDSKGFWKGIKALDYVELFDYDNLLIPKDVHEIPKGVLQAEILKTVAEYAPETKQVKDRAVVEGDSVNIDYVGSVDGVEFSGGNTAGGGADVVAGNTNYIDDFLTQIIGHKPGETFNVEVTFPDEYPNNPDLEGKDAVFVTTINYITEYTITDAFIEEKLYDENGWKTLKNLEDAKLIELKETAVETYISEYIRSKVKISSIPDKILKYQNDALVEYHKNQAVTASSPLEKYLKSEENVSDLTALLKKYEKDNINNSKYYLVIQAIAEDAEFTVTDKDMDTYMSDYASRIEEYGMPYLRQYVLGTKVLEYLKANSVLE